MGFKAKAMPEALSTLMEMGVCGKTWRSLRRQHNQVISQVVSAKALYSASVEDLDTTVCFLACHEMRLDPKKIPAPVTDLLE